MRHLRSFFASLFIVLGVSAAAAPPDLPPSAKRLSGADIRRLYDGSTVMFENFTQPRPLTGSMTHDLGNNAQYGSYVLGAEKGTFRGDGRVKGDKYCYTSAGGRQTCGWVYFDKGTIYEVNAKGIVETVKKPQ